MILHAFTDGASRGNPGDSGIGILVKNEQGEVVLSECAFIGRTTNNIAEYTALLTLLDRVASMSCEQMIVHSDSELMVRQIAGTYKVKNEALKAYHRNVLKTIESLSFPVKIRHVAREMNREADQLANTGIDDRVPLIPPRNQV